MVCAALWTKGETINCFSCLLKVIVKDTRGYKVKPNLRRLAFLKKSTFYHNVNIFNAQ